MIKPLELCRVCENPTHRAGKGDDSLYLGDVGPFCDDCYNAHTTICGISPFGSQHPYLEEFMTKSTVERLAWLIASRFLAHKGAPDTDDFYDAHWILGIAALVWEPIATAPRDGSNILVYSPNRGGSMPDWATTIDVVRFVKGEFQLHNVGSCGMGGKVPTHWMMLPREPETRKAGG